MRLQIRDRDDFIHEHFVRTVHSRESINEILHAATLEHKWAWLYNGVGVCVGAKVQGCKSQIEFEDAAE